MALVIHRRFYVQHIIVVIIGWFYGWVPKCRVLNCDAFKIAADQTVQDHWLVIVFSGFVQWAFGGHEC
jgi:hypothetical protein